MNTKAKFAYGISQIKDKRYSELAILLMDKVPDYFWTIPASSTGKYHPQCDLGDGGLVRHSLMVAAVADELVTAEIFVEDTEMYHSMARFASLFHDALKNGPFDLKSEHTVHEHPHYAYEFVKENLIYADDEQKEKYAELDQMILNAIKSHMGKWNTSRYSDMVLPVPESPFEKLIHTADFIASRKFIGGLDIFREG